MLSFMRSATESQKTDLTACMSICDKNTSDSSCNGMNCCQITIPSNLKIFVIEFGTFNRRASCEYYAFLVDQQWFESRSKRYDHIIARDKTDSVPVVLEWNLLYNHSTVKEFQMGISDKVHSYCQLDNTTPSIFNQSMIQCFCKKGFEGNPYLHDGCKDNGFSLVKLQFSVGFYFEHNFTSSSPVMADINECEKFPPVCKDDICNNYLGGYSCSKKAWKKPTTKSALQAVQDWAQISISVSVQAGYGFNGPNLSIGVGENSNVREKNFNVPQDYEEVEDLRTQDFEPWEVVSLSTGPASDTGLASSSHELPLLSFTSL
ncbi:hypothetical protein FEM48_Zijuj04G0154500 [Ziziphus jujuba var. spinosa]|uniref:Uncharacterized protein n=1 Tax=Ziziphus jujuba var. spinosa TaxID=714518 RepID=A0A978VKN4_ZIZJJ|nr:hypothetical protein FEM48_Zijuj04G0154500 [Ziziphus jujuba var. spinosa]